MMKPILAAIAAMTLTAGLAAPAVARPPVHHKHCGYKWVHHHKVRRCW